MGTPSGQKTVKFARFQRFIYYVAARGRPLLVNLRLCGTKTIDIPLYIDE
jgi:hypothetical protein